MTIAEIPSNSFKIYSSPSDSNGKLRGSIIQYVVEVRSEGKMVQEIFKNRLDALARANQLKIQGFFEE